MNLEILTIFAVVLTVSFFLDCVLHKEDKAVSIKSALTWSVFWIGVALAFGGYLYYRHTPEMASLYFTGFALEKALSVDNLFVIMAILSWFKIPEEYKHRVLFWGILGAIVFRGIFVAIGTSLLAFGPWVELLFAAIVAYTAIIMLKNNDDDDEIEDYSNHSAYKVVGKFFPSWPKLAGNKFFISRKEAEAQDPDSPALLKKGATFVTPLLMCVAVIELSDIMFAFDSVPAVIAVSQDPIIVYSAMMFAILGLRNLYFLLEAMKKYLVHLETAVVFLLFYIGGKLALNATDKILGHGIHIDANTSLIVVLVMLSLGVVASLLFPKKDED